jgi:hypothetical protein
MAAVKGIPVPEGTGRQSPGTAASFVDGVGNSVSGIVWAGEFHGKWRSGNRHEIGIKRHLLPATMICRQR